MTTNKPQLIIEIGTEGGSLSAYRIKDENGNYRFHFGTSEIGLDNDDWGISTRNEELIIDFDTLLKKIRAKYPEIYNLHPVFVLPEYSTKVLHDLRNRIKNIHFDYRGWATVLYLLVNRNEREKYTESDIDKIEPHFLNTLKCLDLIDKSITDENIITKEILEKFKIIELDNDAEEELIVYDSYNYLDSLTNDELDSIYAILARQNSAAGTLKMRKNIEVIMEKRIENKQYFEDIGNEIINFSKFSEIANWNNFELNFKTEYLNKQKIVETIKSEIPNYSNVNGFYAIFDGAECLYIGVGRPIWSRIKSHYISSQIEDRAKRWSDFFSKYKKTLKIYWKEFDNIENKLIGDKVRILIESLLQQKYNPRFEQKTQ